MAAEGCVAINHVFHKVSYSCKPQKISVSASKCCSLLANPFTRWVSVHLQSVYSTWQSVRWLPRPVLVYLKGKIHPNTSLADRYWDFKGATNNIIVKCKYIDSNIPKECCFSCVVVEDRLTDRWSVVQATLLLHPLVGHGVSHNG